MRQNKNVREESIVEAKPSWEYYFVGIISLALSASGKILEPDRVFDITEIRIFLFFAILGIALLIFACGSKVTYSKKDKILTVTRLFIFEEEYKANEMVASFEKRLAWCDAVKLVMRTKKGDHVAWIPDNWRGYNELKRCFFPLKYRTKRKKK